MNELVRAGGKGAFALSLLTGIAAPQAIVDAACDCQWNAQCYSEGSEICFGWVMVCTEHAGGSPDYSWEYDPQHRSCK